MTTEPMTEAAEKNVEPTRWKCEMEQLSHMVMALG